MSFEYPSNLPIVDLKTGKVTDEWQAWFSRAHTIIASNQQSGATADRPTKNLWYGRRYFDRTIGKAVYVKEVRPAVWVDGDGNVV